MAKKVLTGVKHIYITPWTASDTGLDFTSGALELTNIIADTVAITQDDPETTSIDCETRDEPIIQATTLGDYTVTMDSADIDLDILVKCLGFTKVGTDIAYAPAAYTAKYAEIVVEMSTDKFILPRVQMNSKIDASSLKTGVAKGTIGGSAQSANITVGSGTGTSFDTPFFVAEKTWDHAAANAAKKYKVAPLNVTA